MSHPVEGLKPGPLAGQDFSLLKAGDVLRVTKRELIGEPSIRISAGTEVLFEKLDMGLVGVSGDFWGPNCFDFVRPVSTKPQGGDQGALQAQAPSVTTEGTEGAVVAALQGVLEWDKARGYRMPYRVRDPIYAALDAIAKGGAS